MRKLLAGAMLVIMLTGVSTIAGCAQRPPSGKIDVVASFYPLAFLAQRIGGDLVSVTNLVKPGTEPHDLELTPKQVASIADADLVLYLKTLQPAVDDAVRAEASHRSLDVTMVEPLVPAPAGSDRPDALDPHIWLDPVRFEAVSEAVAARLAALEPAHAGTFNAREAALRKNLGDLNADYAKGLANCARRDIVTSHAAFGYLASRYGLNQIPITGLTPEAEPQPQDLANIAKLARDKGVTTIFFETLASPRVARTLATEVGAKAEVLDPIEGVTSSSGETYLTVMARNLDSLRAALGCS